jgi:DNA-binding transcriptional ArsR family regulator
MLRVSKSRSYSVPVVLHTLNIIEVLSESDFALKANEISDRAGVSHSTTYRILRTLVQRGYVSQDLDGRFRRFRDLDKPRIVPIIRVDQLNALHGAQEPETNVSADQLIEMLLALLQGLRNGGLALLSVDNWMK